MMKQRGPNARERRTALTVGLTLHEAGNGWWVARDSQGPVTVILGSDAGWRDFRAFVAEVAGDGFRFE